VTKKKTAFSQRAAILGFVLDCINTNRYEDHGDYMIFGTKKDTIIFGEDDEVPQDESALREFFSDFETYLGRLHAKRRTSLEEPPLLKRLRGWDRLSDETKRMLSEAVRDIPVHQGRRLKDK